MIPDNAKALTLDGVPSENLKSVRLQVDFGGRHRGNAAAARGTVAIYSDMDSVFVAAPGANVELKTTSPTIHFVPSADAGDLLVKVMGYEQSQMAEYHAAYPRHR